MLLFLCAVLGTIMNRIFLLNYMALFSVSGADSHKQTKQTNCLYLLYIDPAFKYLTFAIIKHPQSDCQTHPHYTIFYPGVLEANKGHK